MRANTCATRLYGWMRGLAGVFVVMAILISMSCAGKKGTDRLHPAFLIPADIVHFVEMTFATDNAIRNMRQNGLI